MTYLSVRLRLYSLVCMQYIMVHNSHCCNSDKGNTHLLAHTLQTHAKLMTHAYAQELGHIRMWIPLYTRNMYYTRNTHVFIPLLCQSVPFQRTSGSFMWGSQFWSVPGVSQILKYLHAGHWGLGLVREDGKRLGMGNVFGYFLEHCLGNFH